RPADPLAVADDQIAQLAVRVELVEEAVGIARPWDELVLHLDAGLLGEILAELDKGVCRIPCRPAQGKLALSCSRLARKTGQRHGGEQRAVVPRPLRPSRSHACEHVFPSLEQSAFAPVRPRPETTLASKPERAEAICSRVGSGCPATASAARPPCSFASR